MKTKFTILITMCLGLCVVSCSNESMDINITHIVAFETNGGNYIASLYVEDGTTIEEPIKGDEIFAGWFCNTSLTTQWDFLNGVTEDIILYAKWISVSGDITIEE